MQEKTEKSWWAFGGRAADWIHALTHLKRNEEISIFFLKKKRRSGSLYKSWVILPCMSIPVWKYLTAQIDPEITQTLEEITQTLGGKKWGIHLGRVVGREGEYDQNILYEQLKEK